MTLSSGSERRARIDPSLEAAALVLRDRLRRGELAYERARLAGSWGHPIARLLFPELAVDDHEAAILEGLELLADGERRLFACDCAERVLWIFERDENDPPQDYRARGALRLIRMGRRASGLVGAIKHDYDCRMDDTMWAAFAVDFAAQDFAEGAAYYASLAPFARDVGEEQAWQRRRLAEVLIAG